MSDYSLSIKKTELLNILSKYYSEKFNRQISVKETTSIEYVGLYETEEVHNEFYYEESLQLLGSKCIKRSVISLDDIRGIIDELLQKEGFCVKDISLNNSYGSTGYYEIDKSAYLCSVELNLEKNHSRILK